ncbi:MAG: xanthine dehydrogenase family protein molybdopterin-binding subunit [Acidobacteriaceae bacterium]|nr:xanthine dehydrogenase family protein molybdopterin-binding subunit [Acidobacteriaceae bacterium]
MPEIIHEVSQASSSGLDRRKFLRLLGGGLVVLLAWDDVSTAQESGRSGHGGGQQLPQNVGAWLHIAPDGRITTFTGKVEVGQNIRTSLTQAVADELRCAPSSVELVMGDTALVPWDAGTFGSRSTPTMAPQLRRMASTARELLIDQAAKSWNSDRNRLKVKDGFINDEASGRRATLGALAAEVDWVNVIAKSDCVTPSTQWQVAGTSLPKVNAKEMVSGKHQYASDYKVPGMLYGRVLRPPSFGAKLLSADTSKASAIPGVQVVRDGDFIGIAATDEQKAQKALLSINAKWEQQSQISGSDLFRYIRKNADSDTPPAVPTPPQDSHALQSTYTVAYIAHVPLEPRAAVAQVQGDQVTVWTGTQRPFGVRSEVASALGLTDQQVRVLVPDTGSGYGGKHNGECAIEAARLAKAAGKPVKLIWSREEEFTWAYLRPAGVIEVHSAADQDGTLRVWNFHNYMSGPSGLQTPYEVREKNEHFHPVKSPLREGSYRGLAATANHFARESHMDELAAAVGMDPLVFRRKNLSNERLLAVLQAAADRFGWSERKASANRGFGLACGMEKGGYVACCTEISVASSKQVQVERVVAAWECGAIVNPEHLKNQVEGAIVMGLGGALFEAIDFANGRILNPRLSQYRVPRFSDVPKIDLVLIDRRDLPSAGAGETPIVGIAPAVANAIYSATGLRIRSMPILPSFRAS